MFDLNVRRIVAHLPGGQYTATIVHATDTQGAKKNFVKKYSLSAKFMSVQVPVSFYFIHGEPGIIPSITVPNWGQEKIFWPEELKENPEKIELFRIIIFWADNTETRKDFYPGCFQNIELSVQKTIDEHTDPSPHSGIPTLKEIHIQHKTQSGWSKQEVLWPPQ
jgi:hypothetical protein